MYSFISFGFLSVRLFSICLLALSANSSLIIFCACPTQLSQMCPVIPAIKTFTSLFERPQNEHLTSFFSIFLFQLRHKTLSAKPADELFLLAHQHLVNHSVLF